MKFPISFFAAAAAKRLVPVLLATSCLALSAAPMSAAAYDQYGPEPQDCTVAHPCNTAQLQAAQAARLQAAQSPAGQAAAKAAADAAEAAREAASLATHHKDQYGLIGDDCTVSNPCVTAQVQAAQAARLQAAQSPAGQAAAKAAADAAEAAREAVSLATHHKDQYGLIGDDCTVSNPCVTAQVQAAQQARQAAQRAAAKAAADAKAKADADANAAADAKAAADKAAAPPNCNGLSIPFTDKLRAVVGSTILKPVVTCPVVDPATGDLSQQTQDGGTLYQRASTSYTDFTNGETHWTYAVDPDGKDDAYVWVTDAVDPPDGVITVNQQKAAAAAASAAAAQAHLEELIGGPLSSNPCLRVVQYDDAERAAGNRITVAYLQTAQGQPATYDLAAEMGALYSLALNIDRAQARVACDARLAAH